MDKENENEVKRNEKALSRKHQFTNKLYVTKAKMEKVNEAKLLGTIITSDLK